MFFKLLYFLTETGAITESKNDFFILVKQKQLILTEDFIVYAVNCTVHYFSLGLVYG